MSPSSSPLMVIATMIVMICRGAALTELSCSSGCSCGVKEREYRVICDKMGDKDVYLRESVFSESPTHSIHKTYVRVQGTHSLDIHTDFITKWKTFGTCAMDLWKAGNVSFPTTVPVLEVPDWGQVFAGLGVIASSIPRLPPGLFSGKRQCGLKLQDTEVGVVPPGLFSGVKSLKYLNLVGARVGLFQGPPTEEGPLYLSNSNKVVVLMDSSSVGFVGPRALSFRAKDDRVVKMIDVSLGSVAVGGVELTENAHLTIKNSMVGDLQEGSVRLEKMGLTIENSSVVARPLALSAFPCDALENRILSNVIHVVSPPPPPTTPAPRDGESDANDTSLYEPTAREMLMSSLETVLHPSCVELNLPPWARLEDTDEPFPFLAATQRQQVITSPLLHLGLYAFVGVSVAALLIVVVLACLLVRARRRTPVHPKVTSVTMSDLRDPIYEDAPFVASPPPPVPPPTTLLKGKCVDSMEGACGGYREDRPRVVENDYMVMRST